MLCWLLALSLTTAVQCRIYSNDEKLKMFAVLGGTVTVKLDYSAGVKPLISCSSNDNLLQQPVLAGSVVTEMDHLKTYLLRLHFVDSFVTCHLVPNVKDTDTLSTSLCPPLTCPPGWDLLQDTCFLISKDLRSWAEGQSFCRLKGGSLATISSDVQQEALSRMLTEDTWIGLRHQTTINESHWDDRSAYIYSRWAHGKPKNTLDIEGCVTMSERYNFLWDTADCDDTKLFMCSVKGLATTSVGETQFRPFSLFVKREIIISSDITRSTTAPKNTPTAAPTTTATTTNTTTTPTTTTTTTSNTITPPTNCTTAVPATTTTTNTIICPTNTTTAAPITITTTTNTTTAPTTTTSTNTTTAPINTTTTTTAPTTTTTTTAHTTSTTTTATTTTTTTHTAVTTTTPTSPTTSTTTTTVAPTTTTTIAAFNRCVRLWYKFQNNCYRRFEENVDYATAVSRCSAEGAHLAIITSEVEHLFVKGLLYNDAYIGLTDIEEEGNFKWNDGSSLNYTRWRVGEPNDHFGEDCVVMWWFSNYEWNDVNCHHVRNFVCEKTDQ